MADRFPAQIWIGGQLSRTARLYPDDPNDDTTILQGLTSSLNEDNASYGYGDKVIDPNCTEEQLGGYLTEDGKLLNLKCDEAVNGEFPETEEFCREHGIAFDRWSDHYCQWDAENVGWRPGMNAPVVNSADSCGEEVVHGKIVRQAIEKLEAYVKLPVGNYHELALRLLRDACPELPPELEVFNLFS